jgi:hypothetical protein
MTDKEFQESDESLTAPGVGPNSEGHEHQVQGERTSNSGSVVRRTLLMFGSL